jgi:hypothetical protein
MFCWPLRSNTLEDLNNELCIEKFPIRNIPGDELANDVHSSKQNPTEHIKYLVNHDPKSIDVTFSGWDTLV